MKRGQFLRSLLFGGAGAVLWRPRAAVAADRKSGLPEIRKFDVDLLLEQIDYNEPYEAFEDYQDGLGFLNEEEKAYVAHYRAHRERVTDDGEIPVDHAPMKVVPVVEWDVEGADRIILSRYANPETMEEDGDDTVISGPGAPNPRGRERWPAHDLHVGHHYLLVAENRAGQTKKELWR